MTRRRHALGGISLAAWTALGCAPSIPDPAPTVAHFARASRSGDDQAVYRMLSKDAQRSLGAARVKQLLTEQRSELASNAKQWTNAKAKTAVSVVAHFGDGDTVTLALERGNLRVDSASALPSHAATPQQALLELRAVLQRRSYAGLLTVLTRSSAAGFEEQLASLVTALSEAQSLQVEVNDDRAVITLSRGHRVELRKEGGLWKVHDFE